MKENVFIEKNIHTWRRLEDYNKKVASKSLGSFSKSEIREYAELYRLTGLHLSYSRTHFFESRTQAYLNQLLGVSHNNFYTKERSTADDMVYYFKKTFPTKVNEHKSLFYAATIAFLAGALVCFAFALFDPAYLYLFMPEEQLRQVDFSTSVRDVDYPLLSSFIMTNNIRVCFLAWALGVTAGAGTLFVLLYNGAVIGALTSFVLSSHGNFVHYAALILPHGVIELTAIFISGAAGLIIGRSILIPREMTRKDSFIKGAKEASSLVPGIILMLIVAGIIEGFITPSNIPPAAKLAFAALTLVALLVYFMPAQRKRLFSMFRKKN